MLVQSVLQASAERYWHFTDGTGCDIVVQLDYCGVNKA